MGTRNLICVVKDGEYKVAQYGQWDGYPEGQGVGILDFLLNDMNRENFEEKLSRLTFATDKELKEMWVECGADENSELVSFEVCEVFNKIYPENSRNAGSKILSIIQNSNKDLKLDNALDFAKDSLFCEWVYVVDLDKNSFEVYEGFNKIPLEKDERFYFLQTDGEKYYPVKYVLSFDLNNLPTVEEFLDNFTDEEE